MNTIKPEIVEALLGQIGTRACTVTFIKKDGTTKAVNGFLRPSSRFVGNARGQAQGAAMKARGQVFIGHANQKTDKGEFKSSSFFVDRVVAIKAEGINVVAV